MKVFRLDVDVNRYRYFQPEHAEAFTSGQLMFDGRSRLADWSPPTVHVYKPKLRRPNFTNFLAGTNCLVCDGVAITEVRDMLERSGELLPLPYKGEMWHVLNVTEVVNVLDEDRTEWITGRSTGKRIGIKKYAFYNRFPETPLFKIPESSNSEILTVEGLIDPADEFKPTVERLGLEGLKFEEIWSDAGE